MLIREINVTHAVINEHAAIFYELIDLIVDAMRENGVQADRTINQVSRDKLNVIVGHTIFLPPNILSEIRSLSPSYVVFQLEALDEEQGFLSKRPAYREFLRGAKQVWDYSKQNARLMSALRIADVRHIPIGYSPRLELIVDRDEHDIDVLFTEPCPFDANR